MDVLRNELINEETGIATDKDGNSLGMVEVNTMKIMITILFCVISFVSNDLCFRFICFALSALLLMILFCELIFCRVVNSDENSAS